MRQVNSAMSTSMEALSVSSKQWFLTLNEEHQEVFIWKDGMRLKLKDQSSGGPVKEVARSNRWSRENCDCKLLIMELVYLQNLTCAMIWYGHTFMFKDRGSCKK